MSEVNITIIELKEKTGEDQRRDVNEPEIRRKSTASTWWGCRALLSTSPEEIKHAESLKESHNTVSLLQNVNLIYEAELQGKR